MVVLNGLCQEDIAAVLGQFCSDFLPLPIDKMLL